MTKRLLMIADADGFWTRRYIQYLLLPAGYQVVLFPIWGNQGTHADFYRENGIQVYQDTHRLPVIRHIPRLRMWARIWLNARDLCKMGPFQIIHNHFLSQRDLALGAQVKKRFPGARWVCSFWGSDLLRSSRLELGRMKPYLGCCNGVTIHSALQEGLLLETYGPEIASKASLVYFGQPVLQDIDQVRGQLTKAQCQEAFGIETGRKVVCVGYSASKAQHHHQMLEALAALPPALLANLALVLQMCHGDGNGAYVQSVQEQAQKLPCQVVLLTDFLDGTQSAKLRLAADVFILAIQTDAFSASLQEYLYAGAQAVVGDWLSYPQLQELGITLIPFSDYAQLPVLVEQALAQEVGQEQRERRALLGERYSWDQVREGWLRLYQTE